MTRDIELVRKLLLYFEEKLDDRLEERVVIDGYDESAIAYHMILLYEAGLIEGEPSVSSTSKRIIRVYPMRLTWEGHEFLAAARNDTVWQKTKAKITSGAGDVPYALLKELLLQTARAYIGL
jgi:hypothetical protein